MSQPFNLIRRRFLGVAAGLYLLTVEAAALHTHPLVWCLGFFASLLLPLPIMAQGRAGRREGRIIILAYLLRKHPKFPANRK